jgi:hypothetical protein
MLDAIVALGDWMELHPGLAAWLQALGMTGAIMAAMVVPWAQRRNDRLLQGRTLAAAVAVEVADLRARILAAARTLEAAGAGMSERTARIIVEPQGAMVATLLIPVPPVMAASVHQLYLLGWAGGDVQMLVSLVMRFTAAVTESVRHWGSIDPQELSEMLSPAETIADKAAVKLERLRQGRIL